MAQHVGDLTQQFAQPRAELGHRGTVGLCADLVLLPVVTEVIVGPALAELPED